MRTIFIAGAGKSTPWLIKYLSDKSTEYHWKVIVGDLKEAVAAERVIGRVNCTSEKFDVFDDEDVKHAVERADLLISMLPAKFHIRIAKLCVAYKKPLLTASYVSEEMHGLHQQALENGVLLLNESGLDPGIDHMAIMTEIDALKAKNFEIVSLKSYCGGLIAPESNTNPWGYKFTWVVENVINAGKEKGGKSAVFQEDNQEVAVRYKELFAQYLSILHDGTNYDVYANRDSLKYKKIYGLEEVETLYRGTMRYEGYCKAWNALIHLGLTRDDLHGLDVPIISLQDVVKRLNPALESITPDSVSTFLGIALDAETIHKLDWLGLFKKEEEIPIAEAKNCRTYANILQLHLEKKWKLAPEDKDRVVMVNEIKYRTNADAPLKTLQFSLDIVGDNSNLTAMAKTVGLPLAIAAKLVLEGEITLKGVQVPTQKKLYQPILKELEAYGVIFKQDF